MADDSDYYPSGDSPSDSGSCPVLSQDSQSSQSERTLILKLYHNYYIYMGYSNGLLESEVKGGSGERGEQGLPGIGFKLTDDGNFDIDGKRLTDVSQPMMGK